MADPHPTPPHPDASPPPGAPPQTPAAPPYVTGPPVYGPPGQWERALRPRRRWSTWIGWAGFLLCGFLLLSQWSARRDYFDLSQGIRERFHSGAEHGLDKVAVIAVRGVILDGDGFVKRQIDRIREDGRVKAVVVRIDSPGGTVTGADYIYHHLNRLREERHIPLVVSMGSMAASGGYYVAMAVGDQERSIFAEPTTTTGSIGVIVPHYDLSGLLARFDVRDDSVVSHPRKQLLSVTHAMTAEDRAIVQDHVDQLFLRFKEIVRAGRPQLRQASAPDALVAAKSDRDLATGEIFTASRAQQYGLVDQIGFIEDAIDRAIELAGLDKEQVRVVQYQRPMALFDLVGLAEAGTDAWPLESLLELSAPRAYYLATSLPPLVSSRRESR